MTAWKRLCTVATGLALVLATGVAVAPSSGSVPIGAWSPSSWTDGAGTVAFPGAVGLGPGRATTDATGTQVFGGSSLWMGSDTPFGGVFGSTQGESYAQIGLAPGNAPSTTTVTFPSPSPAGFPEGWGFAVADIDADVLGITAAGPNGALPVSALGFRGVFNLCGNVPKPSACGSPTPTDVPTWDPLTGVLTGSGTDTVGASAWFTPGAGVTSVTFHFSRQIGLPSFDLWFAVNTAPVSGMVSTDGCAPPGGVEVALTLPDGTPVLDGEGRAVTTTTDSSGSWQFAGVVAGQFVVSVVAPAGCVPGQDGSLLAPVDEGAVEGLVLDLVVTPPTPTVAPADATGVPPAFTG